MTLQSSYRRSGLSLIESIVVIAILGVLSLLAAASIHRVRDAAVRMECRNNLRQIGLGLQQHHNVMGQLPAGVTSPDTPEMLPYLGWSARLLPYIERSDLWSKVHPAYRANKDFRADPPHPFSTAIRLYGCRSDSRTLETHYLGNMAIGLTMYLGNAGTNLWTADGVLFLDSRISFSQITDGAAQTLLVGERPPSPEGLFGWWYGGKGQNEDGNGDLVLGMRERRVWMLGGYLNCPRGPYSFGPGRPSDPCDTFHFWSRHAGGSHFLMCDGSVHFLHYSADPILAALATRAGNEPAELP